MECLNSLALDSQRPVGTCDKLSSQGVFSSLHNLREPLRPLIFFSFKKLSRGSSTRIDELCATSDSTTASTSGNYVYIRGFSRTHTLDFGALRLYPVEYSW